MQILDPAEETLPYEGRTEFLSPTGGDRWVADRVQSVRAEYKERLEACGLVFAGMSPDGVLPETVEYPDHPWFIGVQYHPELKSRPFEPHPLFAGFIAAALRQSRLV